MKAIVVFEMPDGINLDQYKGFLTVDRFYTTDEEIGTKIDAEPMKFKWLKIRPLPQKINGDKKARHSYVTGFHEGFDSCIDTITGEEDGL